MNKKFRAWYKSAQISFGQYFTHAHEFFHYGVRVKRVDMKDFYFGINAKESQSYIVVGNAHQNPDLIK